jgi:hypothetical protein
MTQALAIIGSITGVTGSLLALLAFFRDRAKIVVTHSAGTRTTREPYSYVTVFVANHGRQPVAITSAGLTQERPSSALHKLVEAVAERIGSALYRAGVSRDRLGRWYEFVFRNSPGISFLQFWPAFDEPLLLGLGELRQYELPSPDREDFPVYAYAKDSYGRTIFGRFPVEYFGDESEDKAVTTPP